MPTCFVVQGFHTKTDFESGRTLDLDASYDVIKEAVEAAGYTCVRGDEIKHSRNIDLVMYEQLLEADLVIADLSTSNVNAFYELGVRFALRPYTTIVVSESQLNFPFDINHIPIRTYEHLGKDIGRQEAKRFIAELTDLIEAIAEVEPHPDSPVFTFLPGLGPPTMAEAALVAAAQPEDEGAGASLNDLKEEAESAMRDSDFETAIRLWNDIRERGPKDDYFVQQLALATYKSGKPSNVDALHAAREILEYLWPDRSLDPETLGLWAAVNKRLYEAEGDTNALNEAITATEKGWVLRNDYYNGINLAFLLDTRCSITGGNEAREDHARAQGVRRQVIGISKDLLDAGVDADERYWILATLEEASVGLEATEAAENWHSAASEAATTDWMLNSTAEQIGKLKTLLAGFRDTVGF